MDRIDDSCSTAGASIEELPMNATASPFYADETSKNDSQWRLDHSRFEAFRMQPDSVVDNRRFRFGGKSALSGYYQRQNEMIDGFSEMDALEEHLLPTAGGCGSLSAHLSKFFSCMGDTKESLTDTCISDTRSKHGTEDVLAQAKLERGERFAINLSNSCNILLLAAKIFACVESRSLSIIASTLDSLLDLLSGFILWYTAHSMRRENPYKYPIGKKRMQPLGIIVFASLMTTLGFQILFEAGRTLIAGHTGAPHLESTWPWLVAVMGVATVVKLALFLFCSTFSNDIVQAYATDHFFDVVTNTIGLAAALLGQAFAWWVDPAGAILLALYTMKVWGSTVWENVNSLTGRTAPPEYLQKLTYLCWNHHPEIIFIDTVRAYTFGSHYFTEVDIVLPIDMPLHKAHDIGEALQNKLERLPEIERAFVHLDFEVSHQPEHHGGSKFQVAPSVPPAGGGEAITNGCAAV